MKSYYILLLILVNLSLVKVNLVVPIICFYDNTLYTDDTIVTVSETEADKCKESYFYNIDKIKTKVLSFDEVVIDCTNKNNNLILIDDQKTYTYCDNGTINAFTFSTKASRYVAIQKHGIVNFKLTIRLLVNYVPNCGIPKNQPKFNDLRIVGGQTVLPNSWPWQVYITDGRYACGAALIDEQWLVSAAHCSSMDIGSLYAYLGDHDTTLSDGETVVKVTKFLIHSFYPSNNGFDIALLKLERPVVYTDKIIPVCLPHGKVTKVGDKGIVTGWGLTQEMGFASTTLNQVSVTVFSDVICYSNSITDICAGEITPIIHDSCQGDSGGPMVVKDSTTNSYYLAGVVSRGAGCRGRGIYARVSSFEDWIAEIMTNN